MILSNFKPKNHHFGHFIRKIVKKSQNWWFCGCKKSSQFEENSKINIYSLALQIDHPVALCVGRVASNYRAFRSQQALLCEGHYSQNMSQHR